MVVDTSAFLLDDPKRRTFNEAVEASESRKGDDFGRTDVVPYAAG
jgi:uncharacterized protein with PIN domain